MIQDEVESQLSAMFDGELPATECELLSRRIDRDETLRARWSRYALIGAAMRSEPVATARSGFARRVSVALRGAEAKPRAQHRGRQMLLNVAVSASLVVAVAALVDLAAALIPRSVPARRPSRRRQRRWLHPRRPCRRPAARAALASAALTTPAAIRRGSSGEPVSYVTPASVGACQYRAAHGTGRFHRRAQRSIRRR